MKRTHRDDLYCWSHFDEERNLDFNSWLWARRFGNVVVDPLPLSPHDRAHLEALGGVSTIVLTNSDHVRAAEELSYRYDAEICAPRGEKARFPARVTRWLGEGDEVVPGLKVLEVHGSKTPGELALLLEGSTLITGDLIRAPKGGHLAMLPDAKLTDKHQALGSLRRLEELPGLEAVLVGDGWPFYGDGGKAIGAIIRG